MKLIRVHQMDTTSNIPYYACAFSTMCFFRECMPSEHNIYALGIKKMQKKVDPTKSDSSQGAPKEVRTSRNFGRSRFLITVLHYIRRHNCIQLKYLLNRCYQFVLSQKIAGIVN